MTDAIKTLRGLVLTNRYGFPTNDPCVHISVMRALPALLDVVEAAKAYAEYVHETQAPPDLSGEEAYRLSILLERLKRLEGER